MAKYRKVDPRIWNDTKFRALSDSAKLVAFFLLTHPHMTALGAMRATPEGLAAELAWSQKGFREAFDEVCGKGIAKYHPEAAFLSLPKFLKYNPPESPNVVKAWAGALDVLPECPELSELLQEVKAYLEGLPESYQEAFVKSFGKTMPNQEQEQEQEQEEDNTPNGVQANGSAAGSPGCPHQAIIDLYHESLPELRKVRNWHDARRKLLKSRWRESPERQSLEWWRWYFEKVRASPFLLGQESSGERTFQADLEWLIKPSNMAKVIEGKYEQSKKSRDPHATSQRL